MSESGPERRPVTEPSVMRALAHPARMALVEHLSSTNLPASATELAGVAGLSPSATSYHLRELAKAGLVEAAPSRGDGRERLWQHLGAGFQVDSGPNPAPEARAAERALMEVLLGREDGRMREWLRRSGDEPAEWQTATTLLVTVVSLTAAELTELTAAVERLVAPYRRRDRVDPPPEARTVAVQWRAVPTG